MIDSLSLIPRPLPDFISQLRDKIWEWSGNEAKTLSVHGLNIPWGQMKQGPSITGDKGCR